MVYFTPGGPLTGLWGLFAVCFLFFVPVQSLYWLSRLCSADVRSARLRRYTKKRWCDVLAARRRGRPVLAHGRKRSKNRHANSFFRTYRAPSDGNWYGDLGDYELGGFSADFPSDFVPELPPEIPTYGGFGDCWRKIFSYDWPEFQNAAPRTKADIERLYRSYFDMLSPHMNTTEREYNQVLRDTYVLVSGEGSHLHLEAATTKRLSNGMKFSDSLQLQVYQGLMTDEQCEQVLTIIEQQHGWNAAGRRPPPGWITLYEFFSTPDTAPEDILYGAGETLFDDSPQKNAVLSRNVETYIQRFRTANRVAPYSVDRSLLPYLRRAGITAPNEFAAEHVHPFAATMELDGLRFIEGLISNTNYTSINLRNDKITSWMTQPYHTINHVLEVKDINRYRGMAAYNTDFVTPSPVIVAHDVMHFWNATVVGEIFDRNPHLQYLFATVVIPVEILVKADSFWPSIYSIEYLPDNQFKWVPEGDHGGAYVQSLECAEFISSTKLITPRHECLHMGVLQSRYAHHVVCVSRPQLMSSPYRALDRPELLLTPRWCDPFAAYKDRLTSPQLVEKLEDYSDSLPNSNWRDIFTKLRQLQMADNIKVPHSWKHAAVNFVAARRAVRFTASSTTFDWLVFSFSIIFKLALASPNWAWSSFFNRMAEQNHDGLEKLLASDKIYTASPYDWRFPDTGAECSVKKVKLHYIPPDAGHIGRAWIYTAKFSKYLIPKFIASIFLHFGTDIFAFLRQLGSIVVFRFSIDLTIIPAIGIGLFFSLSWDLDDENAIDDVLWGWARVRNTVGRWLRYLWAVAWGLPSSGVPHKIGYSGPYKIMFAWFFFSCLWSRLFYPIPQFVAMFDFSDAWYFGASILFVSIILFVIRFIPGIRRGQPVDRLPHHADMAHANYMAIPRREAGRPAPIPPEPPQPPTIVQLLYQNSPAAPAPQPVQPVLGAAMNFVNQVPLAPPLPPAQVIVQPVPQPVGPQAPPAGVMALFAWRVPPSTFNTSAEFTDTIRQMPLPPNQPNMNLMCVWDCLNTVFGVDPVLLWATFSACHARGPDVATGAVPYDLLPEVFSFFRVSATVMRSTLRNNVQVASDGDPPLVYGVPEPNWPVVVWNLRLHPQDPNMYHLTTALPTVANVANVPHPAPATLIGFMSRFLTIADMHLALNLPTKVFNNVVRRFGPFAVNPAAATAQYGHPNGVLPNGVPAPGGPPPVNIPLIPLQAEHVNYRTTAADILDAQKLARSINKDPRVLQLSDTGSEVLARELHALMKHAQPRDVELVLYHGMPGTGKTRAIIGEINQLLAAGVPVTEIKVAAWSNILLEDIRASVKQGCPQLIDDNFVNRDELLLSARAYVFLDDAGLTWPGYIQLLLSARIDVLRLYMTFDVAQATSVYPDPEAAARTCTPTRSWLSPLSNHYATDSRRLSAENRRLFGLPGADRTHGEVFLVSNHHSSPDIPLIVASKRFAETKNMGGTNTFSIANCQGLTWHGDGFFDTGGLTNSATDSAIWTALTRFTGSIWLVIPDFQATSGNLVERAYGCSGILSSLMALACNSRRARLNADVDTTRIVQRAVQNHLASCLSPGACAQLGLLPPTSVVGGFNRAPDDWLERAEAWASSSSRDFTAPNTHRRGKFNVSGSKPTSLYVPEGFTGRQDKAAYAVRHYYPMTSDTTIKTSTAPYVPPHRRNFPTALDPVHLHDLKPRDEDEELRVPPIIEPTNVRTLGGPREAQRHTRSDAALLQKSINERMPPRRDDPKLNKVDRKRLAQLKKGFAKFVDLPEVDLDFDEGVFEQSVTDGVATWFSGRTLSKVEQSIGKWQVDDDWTFGKPFLKAQYIDKPAARGADVKKGQIVMELPLGSTMEAAPYATYLESMVGKFTPESTLWFTKMNPGELRSWYRKNWQPGSMMTSNDYTGWDSGVDRVFLAFDMWLMKRVGVPVKYRDRYFHIRTNMRSYLGPTPIMQPSGDRWTWVLNTYRNAALTGASLNIKHRTSAVFCGDDSVVLGNMGRNRSFRPTQWPMKPVTVKSNLVYFCAFSFGAVDLTMDTPKLAYSCRTALQRPVNSRDFWRSKLEAFHETADHADEPTAETLLYIHFANKLFDLRLDDLPPLPPSAQAFMPSA